MPCQGLAAQLAAPLSDPQRDLKDLWERSWISRIWEVYPGQKTLRKLRIVMIVLWAFADLNLLDLLKIFTWFRSPTTLPQN